ncbi:iron-containing alcohol dehydrogenase, partial [Desulfosporosinus sp. BG]|uniref:iron-containing alcohol dehydrogenase n=1 Tax=Desulfosporosinus sp. BG TaxID=1633135 RepID=UPI000A579154
MTNKYYMPTRVIIGDDCIIKNSELFIPLGKKALIVTGAQSAKSNGSEKDVRTALESVGINYLVFDKVMSNPTISCVYEGASLAKEKGVDFIIAIGGGSPMDAGKAIALLAVQDIEEESLFSGNYEKTVLPMAFVPTTAGTGSEVTQYSILTNDKAQTKTSIASDLLFPTVTFLDAKYTEHLAVTTTINTAIDALS